MPDNVRVVIDSAALSELVGSRDGPVAKELERVGLQVERGAKRLCPVDTGRLRSSITHRLERDGDELVEVIGSNVEYAVYVELGTRRAHAQPYLRPALAAVRK